MSLITQLIAKMGKEDEERQIAYEKIHAETDKKYEEMAKNNRIHEDRLRQLTESIQNRTQQLINHKHSIDKALQEMDDLPGLPLPHENHSAFIKFMGEIHHTMNSPDILNKPDTLSVENIQDGVICTVENVASDLKECKTEFIQAQALYHGAKELKKLNKADGDKKSSLEDSFNTIIEE